MGTVSDDALPLGLARGRARFEEWRRTRQRRRIPKELWALATKLAGSHGVSATARTLRLNAQTLRERSTSLEVGPSSSSGFVELPAVEFGNSGSWVVELTSSTGARVRLEGRGAPTLDMDSLARELLGNS